MKYLSLVRNLYWSRAENRIVLVTILWVAFLLQIWVCGFDVKIKEWGKYLGKWERRKDREGAIDIKNN